MHGKNDNMQINRNFLWMQVADAKKVRQEMTLAVAAAETTLNKVDDFALRRMRELLWAWFDMSWYG